MYSSSRPVSSRQTAPHTRLDDIIRRHNGSAYLRPIADRSRQTFRRVELIRQESGLHRLILDAGCGTGESTLLVARRNPDALVLGIDKSLHRLCRHGISENENLVQRENALLVRMDCVDFWRLAEAAGWYLHRHLLLYPNPWPKPRHILRRWHAHPVFRSLVGLGGTLELRTNWRVYSEEFARAITALTGRDAPVDRWSPATLLSPFERKYRQSGMSLYRSEVRLEASALLTG